MVPLLVELPLMVRLHQLALVLVQLVLQHQLVELLLVWLKHPRVVLLLELHPLEPLLERLLPLPEELHLPSLELELVLLLPLVMHLHIR